MNVQVDNDEELLTCYQDRIISDGDTGESGAPVAPLSPVCQSEGKLDIGLRTRLALFYQNDSIEQIVNDIESWPIDMSKTWIDDDGDVMYGDKDEWRPFTPPPPEAWPTFTIEEEEEDMWKYADCPDKDWEMYVPEDNTPLNEGWIPHPLYPPFKDQEPIDRVVYCMRMIHATGEQQCIKDAALLDEWEALGLEEGGDRLDWPLSEYLTHDDNNMEFWEEWGQQVLPILSEEGAEGTPMTKERWGAIKAGDYDPLRPFTYPPEIVQAAWEAGISTNELRYVLVHNEVFNLEEHIADPRQGRRPTIGMPHLAQIYNTQVQWLMDSGEDRLRLSERGKQLLAIIHESERSKKFQKATRLWKPPPRPPDL